MNAEFFAAVADIEKEKGIPKEYMYEKITQALLAAFRKDNVEYEGNVEVLLDETAKKIQLVEYKVVVEDVYEPYCEVTLAVAKKVVRGAKLGDTIAIPVETKNFGRIAAQTAKQVIIQGIREAERGNMIREYEEKKEEIVSAVRRFVYNGGGFIGVGEPSGHQHQGHFLQLANLMGVEKETGFTLNYDKYNWEEHPDHFILADTTKPVDFGEGKKSIFAYENTEILVQREKEVQMAVNSYGKGRSVYISGLPYSFENSRVLLQL